MRVSRVQVERWERPGELCRPSPWCGQGHARQYVRQVCPAATSAAFLTDLHAAAAPALFGISVFL
jgi:hypothetical protein